MNGHRVPAAAVGIARTKNVGHPSTPPCPPKIIGVAYIHLSFEVVLSVCLEERDAIVPSVIWPRRRGILRQRISAPGLPLGHEGVINMPYGESTRSGEVSIETDALSVFD